MIIQPMNELLQGIAPLPHLGVIRAVGEDAARFLHSQLTQDFSLLGMHQARLAAFLTAKGRMQASFVGFKRSETEVLLICSADLLAPTLKRLSMFVLRSKVKLTDASADFVLRGLAGSAVAASTASPWSKTDAGDASIVHLYPAAGQARALWVAPVGTPEPAGNPMPTEVWLWGEVQSGVATLTAPLVDMFVPQMLNYESVGGVNFKKGCYPGQEVVARSQFRGVIKRRAYLAHAASAVAVGAEVFSAQDPEQPCGNVVQVSANPGGGFDAIVGLQTQAAQDALHVGGPGGVALQLLPLPYALLEDI